MAKLLEDYTPYMGYVPTYGAPEKLEEDEEFVYYKFKVPRVYIRGIIEEEGMWFGYTECEEESTLNGSVVLGIRHLPVYSEVVYLDSDVDFVYYKVRVPKVLLDTPIVTGGAVKYGAMYEYVDEWELEEEEEIKLPKAGEGMPGRHDELSVKKVKESVIHLYEVTLKCNAPDCLTEYNEVTSDLWDAMYNITCSKCLGTFFSVIGCKAVVEEEGE